MVAMNQPPQQPSDPSEIKVRAVLTAIKDSFNYHTQLLGLTREESREVIAAMQYMSQIVLERIDKEDREALDANSTDTGRESD